LECLVPSKQTLQRLHITPWIPQPNNVYVQTGSYQRHDTLDSWASSLSCGTLDSITALSLMTRGRWCACSRAGRLGDGVPVEGRGLGAFLRPVQRVRWACSACAGVATAETAEGSGKG
jgi:hypothetical protein